jgi:UDP-4-amino-4,6-dideoxy-N-acetyl-beta-L-altrosamine transaminase
MLPYGKQTIDDDDIAAVVAALKSDFLTCGPEIEAFEQEFAALVGAKHAVVVCNATAALHLAMLVAEVGPGDRVVTSPNTFVASANSAAFVGATPDFCDIDPGSYNLDPEVLESGWKSDTKAVVAVAYAGQAANMPEIARIARSRGAIVIEDACHGIGGGFSHEGRVWKLGGHPWADITTFSFHPVKTMTAGEGGMFVTDNDEYASRARSLRSHGIERDPYRFNGFGSDEAAFIEQGTWVYEMQELGYNYRITDIQCALGRSQLKKLPAFIDRRLEIVVSYNKAFADIPWLTTPKLASWLLSEQSVDGSSEGHEHHISWHLYTVLIDFEAVGKSRCEVMAELRDNGVGSQVLYIPIHLQPYYRSTYGYDHGKCPVAERQYAQSISLPLFPALTSSDITHVVSAVKNLAE